MRSPDEIHYPLRSRLTRKAQVTIAVQIRYFLDVCPQDGVEFFVVDGRVQIAPATSVATRTAGMLKGSQPPLSPQEEKAAAEDAMAEEAVSVSPIATIWS